LICLLLLFCSFALAGNIATLDFGAEDSYDVTLAEKEGVRFDILGGNHKIVVRQFKENSTDLTIFVEGAETPIYQNINPYFSINLDFNRDDLNDMKVSYVGYDSVNEIGVIHLDKLEGAKDIYIIEEESSYEKIKNFVLINKIWFLTGLVVLLIIFLNRRGFRKSWIRFKTR